MTASAPILEDHARRIWRAAVEAARPELLLADVLTRPPLSKALAVARRILVVGAGKAGAAMAAAVEASLADRLERVEGVVNVPAGLVRPLRRVRLHAARPDGSNHPTVEGVAGTRQILDLVRNAGPDDVVLCLLSGGGSALLPAPVNGVSLEDKQAVTKLLHACGATINEMNCVRKHLSDVKGGRLAKTFHGQALFSLIISDVIGDPLDVIASGPTAPDPTTFTDALDVLDACDLTSRTPITVLRHLRAGAQKQCEETPKALSDSIHNLVIGNNARSLEAARRQAEELGYRVLNLGPYIEGETRHVATALAGVAQSIRKLGIPMVAPVCLLCGGETTVTLGDNPGRGGRNQEFVLAAALKLGEEGLRDAVVLSGGTDGEDGPTDAAGAIADADTFRRAAEFRLSAGDCLACHDAYTFFDATGGLLRTGLTETNVMDVRLFLLAQRSG